MAFEHVGHGLTETLPASPREGSAIDGGGRGGRRCSRARLAPSLIQILNSNRLTAARVSARESPPSPWRSQSWRRRRGENGRRFVLPVERPTAGVAAEKRRERPRPPRAYPAPRPSAGSLTPLVSAPMSVTGASQDAVKS